MTEKDLKDLGFQKIEYDHYYNYVKRDFTSCDNDKHTGQWYVMYELPNNNRGVITNNKILKQLIFRLYGDN